MLPKHKFCLSSKELVLGAIIKKLVIKPKKRTVKNSGRAYFFFSAQITIALFLRYNEGFYKAKYEEHICFLFSNLLVIFYLRNNLTN